MYEQHNFLALVLTSVGPATLRWSYAEFLLRVLGLHRVSSVGLLALIAAGSLLGVPPLLLYQDLHANSLLPAALTYSWIHYIIYLVHASTI